MNVNTAPLVEIQTLDKKALVDLYEELSPGLFRYAYRLLGSQELAEECVSETFSRFLRALQTGRGPSENVQAYLYRMAHNWITDQYRRKPQLSLDGDLEQQVDEHSNPSHLIADRLERERVRKAIMQLPFEQQRVIELRFLEELSHEEVAAILGKSVEATRALQYRALNALRQWLTE